MIVFNFLFTFLTLPATLGAMVHFQLEDFESTIQDCDRAIELDPNLVKAHYRKGRALYEQINVPGAAQKAIESLEKAH